MKNLFLSVLGILAMLFSQLASAAAVDVTSTVTDITDQMTSITAIGGAVLAIFVGVKAFKWVRRALS